MSREVVPAPRSFRPDVAKPMVLAVGVDGSEGAMHAVETALKVLRPQDKLVILMVYPRVTTLDVLIDPFNTLEVSDKQLRDHAWKQLVKYEDRVREAGAACTTRLAITDNPVREEIVGQLDHLAADIFIVGTRGLGTVGRLVFLRQRLLRQVLQLLRHRRSLVDAVGGIVIARSYSFFPFPSYPP